MLLNHISKSFFHNEKGLKRNLQEYKHVIFNKDRIINDNENYRGEVLVLRENIEKLKYKNFIFRQNEFKFIIETFKKEQKKKIKVCFYVMYDSVFPALPLFETMQKDVLFDPFIVVIPDISRGKKHMIYHLNKTFSSLSKQYSKVFFGYDEKTNRYLDYSDKADLICFANPYSFMTHEFFQIEHILNKKVLPFYINYAFPLFKFNQEVYNLDPYNLFWKVFVENKEIYYECQKFQPLKGKNVEIVGYCKMDKFISTMEKNEPRKKTIIIAPHHTIDSNFSLHISNFLKYYEYILKLPLKYPEINFVFRPHPLLFHNLSDEKVWGLDKTKKYFEKISSFPNMIYDQAGDYFSSFINSDGIIHDCGSFLAEYMFTGKPTCYLLKDEESIKTTFSDFGKKCLDHCYCAFSEKEIEQFINNVIVNDKDSLKKKRQDFTEKYLKINYPNVSNIIINYLKKELIL